MVLFGLPAYAGGGGGGDSLIEPLGAMLLAATIVAIILSYAKQASLFAFIIIGIFGGAFGLKEIINTKITKLYTVKNMHERKQKMYDLSDVFIALPGGIGTLEEISEIITWKSLQIKKTSIHIMNINEYYTPLINQFKNMIKNDFLYFDIFKEVIIHKNSNNLIKHLQQ